MLKWLLALSLLVVAAFALTGCTGNNGDGTSGGGGTSTRARGRNQLPAAPFADLYIVPTTNNQQTDISGENRTFALIPFNQATGFLTLDPGQYDFVYTQPGTKTVIARNITDIAEGDDVTAFLQSDSGTVEVAFDVQ